MQTNFINGEFPVKIADLIIVSDGDEPLNPRGKITDSVWLQGSLKEVGQKDAIIVRPTADGKFVLEDGHTRLTAASALGWETLRAKFPDDWNGDPVDTTVANFNNALLLSMLTSNVRRNVPPSRQGKSFIKLINAKFITVERVAAIMGLDVTTVQDYINLASAPESIQKRVDDGLMAWTAFKEWRKKSAAVKDAIANSTNDADFSVRGLRSKAKEIRTGKPATQKISVIEEVIAENAVNPFVSSFKASAMALNAQWDKFTPQEKEEILLTVINLQELLSQ